MRGAGIILAVALTSSATAQGGLPDMTYNDVSAGYTRTDLDGTGEDASSYTWSATYEFGDRFHLWGSIDRTTFEETIEVPEFVPPDFGDMSFLPPELEVLLFDIPPLEVSVRTLALAAGAGVHGDLTERLSGYARDRIWLRRRGDRDERLRATVSARPGSHRRRAGAADRGPQPGGRNEH